VLPDTKAEVKTASMTVRADNVERAEQQAEDLALASDGVIAGEETSIDPDNAVNSVARLTLRVPNAGFTDFLRALARLGTRMDENESTVDVTSEVVDVATRVQNQRESLARVRALLGRATTIEDILRLESELSRREADLESLEARQKALADKTALATVTLTLVGKSAAPVHEGQDLGFLVGLRKGWDAFIGAVAVGLTVVGALLPFAITLAVLAIPVLLVWRSRLRRTAESSTSEPAATS
jgi:hypothetical protein